MSDSPATSRSLPRRRRWQFGLPQLFLLVTCFAGALAAGKALGWNVTEIAVYLTGFVLLMALIALPGLAFALSGAGYGWSEVLGALGGGIVCASYSLLLLLTGEAMNLVTWEAMAMLGAALGLLCGIGARQQVRVDAHTLGWQAAREKHGRRGALLLQALLPVWLAFLHLAAFSSVQEPENYRNQAQLATLEFIGPSLVAVPILVGCGALWAAFGRRMFALRIAILGGAIALALALPPGDLTLLFGADALVVASAARLVVRWQGRAAAPRLFVLLLTDVLPLALGVCSLIVLAAHVVVAGDNRWISAWLARLYWEGMPLGAALAGVYLAGLTLAAAWAVRSGRPWWLRTAGLLAATAWAGDSLIALGHGVARLPRYEVSSDLGWKWFVVAFAIVLTTAAWFWTWQFATRPPATTPGIERPSTVIRRSMRPAAGFFAIAILLAIAVPPASLYLRLANWPRPAAGASLARNDGDDDRGPVNRANRVIGTSLPLEFLRPQDRTDYLVEHQVQLNVARAAADGAEVAFNRRSFPRELVRLLLFASEEAEASGDLDAALDNQLDALRFSSPYLVGDTLEILVNKSYGAVSTIERLKVLSGRLNSEQKGNLVAELEEFDAQDPSLSAAEQNSRDWYYHYAAHDWRRRLIVLLMERIQSSPVSPAAMKDLLTKRQVTCRVLTIQLALDVYYDEHGRLPNALSELVPGYLAAVPQDPYATAPMVYRIVKKGCLVYSVGPDGVDDGGMKMLNQGWGDDIILFYDGPTE